MKKIVIYLLLLRVFWFHAQEIHFSQFNEHPSLINPALTGATAPSRASIAYRNQWRSVTTPFVTYGATFETRFNSTNWQQVDKFRSMTFKERAAGRIAGGISIYSDNAGDGSMGETIGNISLASFVPVSKKNYFSVGLQASVVQRKVNSTALIFPDQYNGSGYDASMATSEDFQVASYVYSDFAGGVLWSYGQNDRSLLGKKQLKTNLGVSFYHINRSKHGFLSSDKNATFIRYVAHGDLLATLSNPDFALAPSFLAQFKGASNELIAGLMVKRFINLTSKYTGIIKRSSLGLGFYFRNKDAVIVSMALEIKEQLVTAVSYDMNVSRLMSSTNSRGGFELTLRYTPPHSFLYQKKADVTQ